MPAVVFYDVVVAVHVMSIVLAFGVTFAYPVIFPYLGRNHPQALAPVHHAQERIGKFLIMPFATLALITGIYLAADRDYFDRVWVQVPMAILIILLGLGGAFFSPTERKAAAAAEREPGGAEYLALSQRVAKVGALASLLVLVAIFFMVAKPGGY
jgi:disulfide bond formation protein DsbB